MIRLGIVSCGGLPLAPVVLRGAGPLQTSSPRRCGAPLVPRRGQQSGSGPWVCSGHGRARGPGAAGHADMDRRAEQEERARRGSGARPGHDGKGFGRICDVSRPSDDKREFWGSFIVAKRGLWAYHADLCAVLRCADTEIRRNTSAREFLMETGQMSGRGRQETLCLP
mmetsp:Transcript_39855/g.93431  ORF Transcript_39855/g.93431 Transcript_39855/m.93431 type:complete len:168 (-) Transcript_39855:237-740(-)